MAVLKYKDLKNLSKEDMDKKMKDLNLELIKSRSQKAQGTSMKTREIKKAIARILTHNHMKKINAGGSAKQ